MKYFLVLVIAALTATQAIAFYEEALKEWHNFKTTHNKRYKSEDEENYKRAVFIDNYYKMTQHNEEFKNGGQTYETGINEYSDLLYQEFVRNLTGFNPTRKADFLARYEAKRKNQVSGATFIPPANVEFPKSVNWKNLGAVTNVKNQRTCNSCWSFSATGAIEGQHFRKTGELVSLSEQNLMDCSEAYGNGHCSTGGWMNQAFQYVMDYGIELEKDYPYEESDSECRFDPRKSAAIVTGYTDIPSGDEEALMNAIATIGPVSVAIEARDSLKHYKKGIYYDKSCSSERLNHGVLAVGYGTDEHTKQDYWLVKNSWGRSWGENGYVRIARNKGNHCGIATAASFPLV